MNKVKSVKEALKLINSGDTILSSGFMMAGVCEEMFKEIEESFLSTGYPNNLTAFFSAGQGNWAGLGWDHLAHEGLLSTAIGGHFGTCIKLGDLIKDNKVKAYNLPQGVISRMLRDIMEKKDGHLTKVGLYTFVDPEIEGGRINSITTENIIERKIFEGEQYLFYKNPKINIGLIRGTIADSYGNISLDEEIAKIDMLDVAMATKASGGKVIAQVKYFSDQQLTANKVEIPGNFVDAIIVSREPELYHRQTQGVFFDASHCGKINVSLNLKKSLDLNERKVIARRCAMELVPSSVVNLGVGMPEMVASIADEEGVSNELIMTAENGIIGGVPLGGLSFGASVNAWGNIPMADQFAFYNSGGLDITFLGLAQADKKGNINVSKFGPKVAGAGGFINISQNTHKVVYCGTFTAGGLKLEIGNGKLKVIQEGKSKKFINEVEQITFSSKFAKDTGQEVLYVTERAVFKLVDEKLELIEIAPGIDLKKDILAHMEFEPLISKDLKEMDSKFFSDGLIGLKDIIMAKK